MTIETAGEVAILAKKEEREDVVAFLRSLADLDGPHADYIRVLATRIGEEREHEGAACRRRKRQGW